MSDQNVTLLGVDIGTGSSKGVLTRPDGTVIAISEQPHDVSLPRPGWAEHDAVDVWWNDFLAICKELVPLADAPIAGVSVSGIGPCIVPADAEGNPLRPAILYGIDTRSMAEVNEITHRYGESKIVKRCGNPLNAQSIGGRTLWLQRHEPQVWEQTKYWFMASSFIGFRLTGEYFLDHVSASYSEPLYNVNKGEWITKWCNDLAPGLQMPTLRWPGEVAGHVTAEAAALTGLPEGIPVAAGTMDSFADAMSVGVRRPGQAVIIYGSTMSVVLVTEESYSSAQLWSNAHVLKGTHNLASGMATSGSLTKWLRDLVPGSDFGHLTQQAQEVPPGSDGLVILPYFAGERTPLHDPEARGTIIGLTLNHGLGHLYRALQEATAYAARHVLEVMEEAGGTGTRVFAVGGGTKGGLWPQIVSDVTGLSQDITEQTVGACYGDAMFAGMAAGVVDEDAQWSPVIGHVEPNPDNKALYDQLYGVYRHLHRQTADIQHTLANIQHQGVGGVGSSEAEGKAADAAAAAAEKQ